MKNITLIKTLFALLFSFLFYPLAHAQVNPGDLVITEIMNNPSAVSDGDGEWFEVYNTTGSSIDMDGMTISDDGIDSHVIGNSLVVPPGGYVVLGTNEDGGTNGGVSVDYEYSSFFLANSADEIIIKTATATVIDQVFYDGCPNFPDPNGASMSLNPTFLMPQIMMMEQTGVSQQLHLEMEIWVHLELIMMLAVQQLIQVILLSLK